MASSGDCCIYKSDRESYDSWEDIVRYVVLCRGQCGGVYLRSKREEDANDRIRNSGLRIYRLAGKRPCLSEGETNCLPTEIAENEVAPHSGQWCFCCCKGDVAADLPQQA